MTRAHKDRREISRPSRVDDHDSPLFDVGANNQMETVARHTAEDAGRNLGQAMSFPTTEIKRRAISLGLRRSLTVGRAADREEALADQMADRALSQLRRVKTAKKSNPATETEPAATKNLKKKSSQPLRKPRLPGSDFGEKLAGSMADRTPSELRRSLTVGRAADREEALADQMADRALSHLRRKGATGQGASHDPLGGQLVDGGTERRINSLRGKGDALGTRELEGFSAAYGVNLSATRVHRSAESDDLSRSLQAEAFTVGNDVFFRKGLYKPGTQAGDRLLGHELAHVAINNGGAKRALASRNTSSQELRRKEPEEDKANTPNGGERANTPEESKRANKQWAKAGSNKSTAAGSNTSTAIATNSAILKGANESDEGTFQHRVLTEAKSRYEEKKEKGTGPKLADLVDLVQVDSQVKIPPPKEELWGADGLPALEGKAAEFRSGGVHAFITSATWNFFKTSPVAGNWGRAGTSNFVTTLSTGQTLNENAKSENIAGGREPASPVEELEATAEGRERANAITADDLHGLNYLAEKLSFKSFPNQCSDGIYYRFELSKPNMSALEDKYNADAELIKNSFQNERNKAQSEGRPFSFLRAVTGYEQSAFPWQWKFGGATETGVQEMKIAPIPENLFAKYVEVFEVRLLPGEVLWDVRVNASDLGAGYRRPDAKVARDLAKKQDDILKKKWEEKVKTAEERRTQIHALKKVQGSE